MHVYEQTEDGIKSRHFVEMSSRPGQLRPTRITDFRKWIKEGREVRPSVTTILDVRGKPGLVNWKITQHLETAYDLARKGTIGGAKDVVTPDQWIQLVRDETEKRMDVAPSAGTDLHKLMEDYLRFDGGDGKQEPIQNYTERDLELAYKVADLIAEETQTGFLPQWWDSEAYFVSGLGFGGCADLSNDTWVIDYKTKLTAEKFKPGKMVYPEHAQQLAAYREGLGLPNARAANLFVSLEDGRLDWYEHPPEELNLGWRRFQAALALWKIDNGMETEL